ncbi:MAG: alanine racemase [Herminiimonas sp.]|nr:alanine racemase [Herminiimonas sp.]
MPRPLVVTIHIAALQHNLSVAARHAGNAKVWAVVKAAAYGHGLRNALRGFATADGLALIEPENAVLLREAGWRGPILLLEGFFDPADLATVVRHDLNPAIHCEAQLRMLELAVRERGISGPLDVHLKLNSGMNRLGFTPEQFRAAYARLRALPCVRGITLMTHLANADAPDNPVLPMARQVACFEQSGSGLDAARTLANSAADLLHPELSADWVRPGIMLYGGSPSAQSAAEFGLEPAMTLRSELIGVQNIGPGDAVGYGSRFVATKPMCIGVVACGYADGYPRQAPDGTPVIVDGVRCALIGRVSMDMLTVDLSPVPQARVGSAVTLWGRGLPIDEVARAAGTIGYELMCAIAPRVHMVDDPQPF